MAGKRNHEWPQATIWDGFFTQDKDGGTTQRVDPALVFSRLSSEGFFKNGDDYLQLDTTPESVPSAVGTMSWNADDGTLDVQQPNGVTLQVGQEFLIHVVNKTGALIPNGAPVYLTGSQGNRPTVALAEADVVGASHAIAVATQDIANNADGYVTRLGLVRGINTSAWAEGAALYLSNTAGGLSMVAPTSRSVQIGYVVRVHATVGAIFVAIDRSPNLGDLGDVAASAPVDGQMLSWNASSSKWVPVVAGAGLTLATATPLVEAGSGTVGTSNRAAREDHVHPANSAGSSIKSAATMRTASASALVQLQSASSTQWTAHSTLFVPEVTLDLVVNSSTIKTLCPQYVSGASYIFAIYKWTSGKICSRVAQSAIHTMPGEASWLQAILTALDEASLDPESSYYATVLWNGNGAGFFGVNGVNGNAYPYISGYQANLGVLTAAPATLTFDGEIPGHLYFRVDD